MKKKGVYNKEDGYPEPKSEILLTEKEIFVDQTLQM